MIVVVAFDPDAEIFIAAHANSWEQVRVCDADRSVCNT